MGFLVSDISCMLPVLFCFLPSCLFFLGIYGHLNHSSIVPFFCPQGRWANYLVGFICDIFVLLGHGSHFYSWMGHIIRLRSRTMDVVYQEGIKIHSLVPVGSWLWHAAGHVIVLHVGCKSWCRWRSVYPISVGDGPDIFCAEILHCRYLNWSCSRCYRIRDKSQSCHYIFFRCASFCSRDSGRECLVFRFSA